MTTTIGVLGSGINTFSNGRKINSKSSSIELHPSVSREGAMRVALRLQQEGRISEAGRIFDQYA